MKANVLVSPAEMPGTDSRDRACPSHPLASTIPNVLLAGYGKAFLHAGDKEWGVGKMQHDLTDAVQWAIDEACTAWARARMMRNHSHVASLIRPQLHAAPMLVCHSLASTQRCEVAQPDHDALRGCRALQIQPRLRFMAAATEVCGGRIVIFLLSRVLC